MASTLAPARGVNEIRELLSREVDHGRLNLPVMPEIALRVREAVSTNVAGVRELALLVEQDPGLAARILKVANSSMYAGLAEIVDLPHAIGRLGTAMVVAIALGAASKESYRSNDPQMASMLRDFWRRSIFAAAAARLLAGSVRISREEAFLAALLHAVGAATLVQSAEQLARSGEISPLDPDLLAAAIAPLSAATGAWLLDSWGLPDSLVEAIRHQDACEQAAEPIRGNAALIGLAAALGRGLAEGVVAADLGAMLAELPAAHCLQLSSAALGPIAEQALADGREVAGAFE